MRILVVDDNPVLTMVLSDHLAARGHSVVPAYNGRLGSLFCMQKHFDLVVVDFVLPDLDGIEVLKRLRRSNQNSRAIIITGFPELLEEDAGRLVGLDVEAVIEKPFDFSVVDELIEISGE